MFVNSKLIKYRIKSFSYKAFTDCRQDYNLFDLLDSPE